MFGRLHTSAPWRCFCVVLSCRQRLRVQGSCISLLNFSASSINNNQKPRSLLYTWLFIVSNSLCIKPFHCIHQMQQLSSEENYTHVPKKKKKKKRRKTIRNSTLGVATGPCRYINYNRFRPISIAMTDT